MSATEPLITKSDGRSENVAEWTRLSSIGIRVVFKASLGQEDRLATVRIQDLEFEVSTGFSKKKQTTLIHRMSGYINPGEMTAIVPPLLCPRRLPTLCLDGS